MKKILVLSILITLLLSATAFSQAPQKLTLKGEVYFNEDMPMPLIKQDNKEYGVMIPRFFNVKKGDKIEVEGYDVSFLGKRRFEDTKIVPFHVTKLTLNGKMYDLENDFDFGPRGGMGKGDKRGKGGCADCDRGPRDGKWNDKNNKKKNW